MQLMYRETEPTPDSDATLRVRKPVANIASLFDGGDNVTASVARSLVDFRNRFMNACLMKLPPPLDFMALKPSIHMAYNRERGAVAALNVGICTKGAIGWNRRK